MRVRRWWFEWAAAPRPAAAGAESAVIISRLASSALRWAGASGAPLVHLTQQIGLGGLAG